MPIDEQPLTLHRQNVNIATYIVNKLVSLVITFTDGKGVREAYPFRFFYGKKCTAVEINLHCGTAIVAPQSK